MHHTPFHQIVKEMNGIDDELRRLTKLKNPLIILKLFLIGFVIKKKVNGRITELISKRNVIIENLDAPLYEELKAIKEQLDEILISNTYLTKDDEDAWLKKIENLKLSILTLKSSNVFEEKFILEKSELLDRYRNTISTYNKGQSIKEISEVNY